MSGAFLIVFRFLKYLFSHLFISLLNYYLLQQLIKKNEGLRREGLVQYLMIKIPSRHCHLDLYDKRAELSRTGLCAVARTAGNKDASLFLLIAPHSV